MAEEGSAGLMAGPTEADREAGEAYADGLRLVCGREGAVENFAAGRAHARAEVAALLQEAMHLLDEHVGCEIQEDAPHCDDVARRIEGLLATGGAGPRP